jgi:multiple sugar transport system ATP-binding protein
VKVAVDARAGKAGDPVSIGIRPEHLLCGTEGEGSALPVKLRQMERLGNESLLYLDVAPDAPLATLRLEGHALHESGETIILRLRAEHCHLFDAKGQAFTRTVELPT